MAWASRKLSHRLLLRNWVLVYLGNFAGAAGTAVLVFASSQYTFGDGAVGAAALAAASAKLRLGFFQAIVLGMLANALVCLAVWLAFSARTTTDRILARRSTDRRVAAGSSTASPTCTSSRSGC